jgi:hypothetical protein
VVSGNIWEGRRRERKRKVRIDESSTPKLKREETSNGTLVFLFLSMNRKLRRQAHGNPNHISSPIPMNSIPPSHPHTLLP